MAFFETCVAMQRASALFITKNQFEEATKGAWYLTIQVKTGRTSNANRCRWGDGSTRKGTCNEEQKDVDHREVCNKGNQNKSSWKANRDTRVSLKHVCTHGA
ncbi:hypothetical protein V6Z88_005697 [Aspergillus fumigatus]